MLEYLTAVMRGGETEDAVVVEGIGKGKSKARNVQKGLSAKERLKAAELLGKRYGIFTEKAQIDAEVVHIIDDIAEADENG